MALPCQASLSGLFRTVAVSRMQVARASAGATLIYDVIMLSATCGCGGGGGGGEVSSDETVKHGRKFFLLLGETNVLQLLQTMYSVPGTQRVDLRKHVSVSRPQLNNKLRSPSLALTIPITTA